MPPGKTYVIRERSDPLLPLLLLHPRVIMSEVNAVNGVEESLRLPLEGSEAHGAVVNDCEHMSPPILAGTDVRLKFAQKRKLPRVSVIGQSRFCNNRRSRKDRREASIFGRQTVTMKYAFLYSVCNRTPQGRQGGSEGPG